MLEIKIIVQVIVLIAMVVYGIISIAKYLANKRTPIKYAEGKPTMWCALKTDAIDFSSEFIWLDDYIMNAELSVLKENGCADSVYKIDLERENLLDVLETIKSR